MSDLRKSVLKLPHHKKKQSPGSAPHSKPDYTPVKWQTYFDRDEYIYTNSGTFHMYIKGQSGPMILCLHGGGYNGLTWALFAREISENIVCRIVALDQRGHGNTKTSNDNDLSLETLTQDVADVANMLAEREQTSIFLVGHSMGGAVAVHASYKIDSIVGLCVIDVVEGTALDALSSMQGILRSRPKRFKSIPDAIRWCNKGGQCHNLEAAKVSMPGQIINVNTTALASDEWETFDQIDGRNLDPDQSTSRAPLLPEVDEDSPDTGDEVTEFKAPTDRDSSAEEPYAWTIDLSKTEKFWEHWFQGLSEKFLNTRVPRVLLLANISGLDTKLTVGQMQGKFQLQVLAKTGHAVHEDQPHQVAEILSIYLAKQKCAEPKPGFTLPQYPNTCC